MITGPVALVLESAGRDEGARTAAVSGE
jgi:hypothetical protein